MTDLVIASLIVIPFLVIAILYYCYNRDNSKNIGKLIDKEQVYLRLLMKYIAVTKEYNGLADDVRSFLNEHAGSDKGIDSKLLEPLLDQMCVRNDEVRKILREIDKDTAKIT